MIKEKLQSFIDLCKKYTQLTNDIEVEDSKKKCAILEKKKIQLHDKLEDFFDDNDMTKITLTFDYPTKYMFDVNEILEQFDNANVTPESILKTFKEDFEHDHYMTCEMQNINASFE